MKPILFSGPMVRAILAGIKSQTRRVVKPQPDRISFEVLRDVEGGKYGKPGDRLQVLETWQYADWTEDGYPFIRYRADGTVKLQDTIPDDWSERLTDIWADLSDSDNYNIDGRAADRRWRAPIHMPRWASRITLEITDMRIERLQDISHDDAIAEGVRCNHDVGNSEYDRCSMSPQAHYYEVWESIHGAGYWEVNPFVWVVSFRMVK